MKVFWVALYPKDPSTGAEVEFLFTSRNHPQATTIVAGKTYLPLLESYPRTEISVFTGEFNGKSESKIDNLEFSLGDSTLLTWPNLVWDGATARVFKGYDTTVDWASVDQIFDGVVSMSPVFDGDKVVVEIKDHGENLDRDLLSLTYAGSGGIEGPAGLKGVYKPLPLGNPKGVEPILIEAPFVVFQYCGYGESGGVVSLWENGLSFGAAKTVVAYQGSVAATYTALKNTVLAVGEWADAPSIGCFRLGGEPKSGGVITCDVSGIKNMGAGGYVYSTISQVLLYLLSVAGENTRILTSNLDALYTNTSQHIVDYFTEQVNIRDLVEKYLRDVGGYMSYTTTGGIRFGLIRMGASAFTLATDGRTTPVVEDINRLPVSAPFKEINMGIDKCFRVHSNNEISDALVQAYNDLGADVDTLQSDLDAAEAQLSIVEASVASIGADGVLSRVEKQVVISNKVDLDNEYSALIARADGYGITTEKTNYVNSRNALYTYLGTLTPAWDDTTQNTPINSATFRANWADTYLKRQLLMHEIAERAEWAGVASRPSNLVALTGTEGINNGLVQISQSGALSGAGGGQVTFPALAPTEYAQHQAIAKEATTGDNRILNSRLAANLEHYTMFQGQHFERVAGSAAGDPPFYIRKMASGDGITTIAYPNNNAVDSPPAKEGERWITSIRTRTGPMTLYFEFRDSSNTVIAGSQQAISIPTYASWTTTEVAGIAPAGTAKVALQYWAGNRCEFGEFSLLLTRSEPFRSPLSGSVNRNPDIKEVAPDGRPASFMVSSSGAVTPSLLGYSDGPKTILRLNQANNYTVNSAFRVERDTVYEVEVVWAGDGAQCNLAYMQVAEYDSELAQDIQYIRHYTNGEPNLSVAATRLVTPNTVGGSGQPQAVPAVSGGYTRHVFLYTPTSTAKWASIGTYENSTARLLIKRVFVRSRASFGAKAGASGTGNLVDENGTFLRNTGTDGVRNNAIQISAGGALSGAGGGQVTLAGIDTAAASPGVRTANLTTSGRGGSSFVSGTDARPYGKLVAFGEAHNGDVITFPSTLSSVPKITFLPGGIGPGAGKTIAIRADGLTVSGFTFKATEQTVTAGSTITDTTKQTVTGTSAPDYQINRSNSGAPYDGKYTYTFTVSVPEIAPGEPGSVNVGIFVLRGGVWTQIGSAYFNNGTGNKVVTVSGGSVDYNTGASVYEFGIEVLSGNGTITNFVSVSYTLGSVVETALTSTINKIPFQAFLEQ